MPDDFDGIVFDIGCGEFDHHSSILKTRPNGVAYASFGLLWKKYGSLLLDEKAAEAFDENFVQKIDMHDNGVELSEIGLIIKEMNPMDCHKIDYDNAFSKAVEFAREILKNKINIAKKCSEELSAILAELNRSEDGILVLERYSPAFRQIDDARAKMVIYPSVRGGYIIQMLSMKNRNEENSLLFPESWRGASEDALKKCSGIDDMVFCHPGGFMGTTLSFESAVEVAQKVLAGEKQPVGLCKKS